MNNELSLVDSALFDKCATNHALTHTFILTKPIWFDEKDDGNYFFSHFKAGTVLEVDAVLFYNFQVNVLVHESCDFQNEAEISIDYLVTHCQLHGEKQLFTNQASPVRLISLK